MLFPLVQYADKLFAWKPKEHQPVAHQIWDVVRANDKKAVYGFIVNSEIDINVIYGQGRSNSSLTHLFHLAATLNPSILVSSNFKKKKFTQKGLLSSSSPNIVAESYGGKFATTLGLSASKAIGL
ncbi:hypothetical protein C2S52_018709 [Perilla frutescens var. hirtella]|nr:hypothetical protein C2S52_018709 [Perilla frutescens var. hirtella]